MDDRFDQEFYRSEWQRVLPLGPHGIQPYVRASRTGALPGRHANLERLIATLGTAARDVIALGRFAAIGVAKRSMLPASAPHTQRPRLSRRLLHDRGHLVARRAAATRRTSKRLSSHYLRARSSGRAERTETIEGAGRHHRETRGDYVGTQIRQQWCKA